MKKLKYFYNNVLKITPALDVNISWIVNLTREKCLRP